MRRQQYLAELLRLYIEAPDTPSRPSRGDWAIAAELYRQRVSLDHLAHAIRLATLRRRLGQQPQLQAVYSIAYYRTVLQRLTDDDLDPTYVDYVRRRYQRLYQGSVPKTAGSKPESRAL